MIIVSELQIKYNNPHRGVGKTSLVMALGQASRYNVVRINLSEQTVSLTLSLEILKGNTCVCKHYALNVFACYDNLYK